jgi:hypothetical protein
MARLLFASGARGRLVKLIQRGLKFAERDVDGDYGKQTREGVTAFQQSKGLPQTGKVDADTWTAITKQPVPSLEERALELTAVFEGHGFELAQGNFDGAGITWGIIGYTLKHGELTKIVKEVKAARPDLVKLAFGPLTNKLLEIIDAPLGDQIAFADSVSIPPKKALLAEPWRGAFHLFGSIAEVQEVQISRANQDYFQPALQTAAQLNLKSELGVALAFDIHVQNGGVKKAIKDRLLAQVFPSEKALRIALANEVADASAAAWVEDVRSRKLAIATGEGTVHGGAFTLKSWGLDELEA